MVMHEGTMTASTFLSGLLVLATAGHGGGLARVESGPAAPMSSNGAAGNTGQCWDLGSNAACK
jgi:hypothetical protein